MRERRLATGLLGLLLVLAACRGEHQGAGTPVSTPMPTEAVAERATRQAKVQADSATQILFGDLHVHTTFSPDAFVTSLPLMGGEGLHPPADACDYARFCAALDFWSINDHAEGISPQHWRETVQAIQECNAVSGDGDDPDTVAFLGWEWSQVGATPETHYGHKNVIFRDTQTDRVPTRPIAAVRPEFRVPLMPLAGRIALPLLYFSERQRYYDYFLYQEEVEATPDCEEGADPRELPADCHETARDPKQLFAKLDAWGFPSLVIPHGTSWGLMTPARSSWDLQRAPGQHDPKRQKLFEIYSGHGSSEENRDWRAVDVTPSGEPVCGAPSEHFEACCWRAGEIIRGRCEDPESGECEARVVKAQADYIAGGVAAHNSVPGATAEDWLDCGQCRDCFAPAFNMRPGMSGQFALASDFRFGFIGSSDTHGARGGNGFKEHARRELTEARAPSGPARRIVMPKSEPTPESVTLDVSNLPLQLRRNTERGASYLLTGGIAAVHATGRDRGSIWHALENRNVYGTSGDRILLWFDLQNGPEGPAPMGADVANMDAAPRFRVTAAGAFFQQPGCPEAVESALGPDRLAKLCLGECYSPGERRKRITRIEVVRITLNSGQSEASGERIQERIEDPWRVLPCAPSETGCRVEFDDPSFMDATTPVAYYVRAIQEPSQAVNGGGLRCELDEQGRCIRVRPCYPDDRTQSDDACLGEIEERAWSSPIFVSPSERLAAR